MMAREPARLLAFERSAPGATLRGHADANRVRTTALVPSSCGLRPARHATGFVAGPP
jgi:hypothetical protein